MDFLIVVGVAFVAAGIQGFLGFGFGIVCIGLFTKLLGFDHATALVNIIGMIAPFAILIRFWQDVEWGLVRILLPLMLVGIVFGVATIVTVDAAFLTHALGGTIVVFSAWSLWRGVVGASLQKAWAYPAGFLSGLLSGAFNIGGPPLIAYVYRQPLAPAALKSTVQFLFITTALVRIVLIASQGYMTRTVLIDSAWCFIPVVAGSIGGVWLGALLAPERFRRVAWVGFALMGAWLAVGG